MIFYSHSQPKLPPSKEKEGTKVLIDHIEGVKDNAVKSIHPSIDLPFDNVFLKIFISDTCDLHDLGKYTSFFQDYLLGRKFDNTLKQHSYIGACTFLNQYWSQNDWAAMLGYFLIYHHHSPKLGLFSEVFELQKKKKKRIIEKQKESIAKEILSISKDLKKEDLLDFIKFPNFGDVRDRLFDVFEPNIRNYFLTNYTFSLLIEADKLDASNTCRYDRKKIKVNLVDNYIQKIIKKRNIDVENPQNKLRTAVRKTVVSHLERPDILDKKLFTLTAPTGIGKTLTALDFAIRLKELIRAEEGRHTQIICALPFINIIEQTLSEYQNVLPKEDVQLFAHYQYADIFEQDRKGAIDPDDGQAYQERLMQLDTWQCDVVITSFVQLLQTLIGYRNKILKKFNHLAGSIIIMDEVQNIPLHFVPLVGASLYYLAELLDARIILMTATEPLIFPLANQEILEIRNAKAEAFPLLPNAKAIFTEFRRTKLVPLHLEQEPIDVEGFSKLFGNKWKEGQSSLIVCNTVNRSIEVFEAIKSFIEKKEQLVNHPVYYLSTNLIPFHRLYIIEQIKKDLKNNIKPILVATQCVEAGVDLDFDIGFRDIAPIDSIVQVAGRVNRNNDPDREHSCVYIFNFGDCDKVYGDSSSNQVKEALRTSEGYILERDYYDLVKKYFESKLAVYSASRNIFEAMEKLDYDKANPEKYNTVSSFQLITQNNRLKSVFVATDEQIDLAKHKPAKIILEEFDRLLNKKIGKREFNQKYKRDFHQRIVAVPDYYLEDLTGDIYNLTEDIKLIPKRLIQQHYNETGFIRKPLPQPISLQF